MTKEQRLIRRALELVRDGLRSGGIPQHNFSMANWMRRRHCGSVGCIAGWTETLLHKAGYRSEAYSFSADANGDDCDVHRLTHPSGWSWMGFTTTQAADAIDRYLAGQEPWPR